ncbi:RING-like zinc finger [Rhizoctonia solani]|uniref:RING-like zinc finger n=1 Tax=Rhizoctonia solani TaxID=456999 RepID=A0A8H7IEA0_9AGAM|nr:RING-like zinc finger [Rhizoctonia solani]
MKVVLAVLAAASLAWGYIPAEGTNDTQQLNLADASSLKLASPIYTEEVSYQLARTGSSGFQLPAGAFVHFDESSLSDPDNSYTPTPWIAMISCDKNSTNASNDTDIFTSARDRGAVAALLYSTKSQACLINPSYSDADEFDRILDIFATKDKFAARLIESLFTNVNKTYRSFNSKLLNESYLAINNTDSFAQVPFLMASLTAWNATSTSTNTTHSSPLQAPPWAIRAIRHPERYGPRSGDPNLHGPGSAPQTRAAGLARAVLDTFPVVKFGRPSATTNQSYEGKDYETKDVEMTRTSGSAADLERGMPTVKPVGTLVHSSTPDESSGTQPSQPVASGSSPSSPTRGDNLTRVAIGVETCPICILDFEDGDDLRVLPCEGRHRFHRDCVDQWLLELSSSCPLCREDFAALEAMAAGNHPDDVPEESAHGQAHGGSRFSKYLRFARHRREQSRSAEAGTAPSAVPQTPTDPDHETSAGWRPRAHPSGNEPTRDHDWLAYLHNIIIHRFFTLSGHFLVMIPTFFLMTFWLRPFSNPCI